MRRGPMRYAYATTAALLLGGSALSLMSPVGAQVAQNEEGQVARAAPPGRRAPPPSPTWSSSCSRRSSTSPPPRR